MEGKQRLFYALGQLILCVALADKEIQQEELDRVHSVIEDLSENENNDFNIAEIVILLQRKQKVSSENAYQWALQEIKLCKHYFDQKLKDDYFFVLTEVAKAFNCIEADEESLISRIKDDVNQILLRPVH